MIKRVKGTLDLIDMRRYSAVLGAARSHLTAANFSPIQLPILEYVQLFQHSVGEHTDIVTKEMYTFSANGKETLCLRPEGTAGTVRAFLENKIEDRPWNTFSAGPMFRHERPQKGRFRQFHQLNIESIGTSSVIEDVRMISILDDFFMHKLNVTDYVLSINYLGTSADRTEHRAALATFLEAHKAELCETCQTRMTTNMLRVFDCKNENCQKHYQDAPKITDHLSDESQAQWEQLTGLLDMASISYVHNPFLVRGLDYYNNTVFEFSSPLLGAQSAFCGGGQYDLSKQLGQKNSLQSIGAAIGLDRLVLLLEAAGDPLALPQQRPLHAIIPFSDEQLPLALLAHQALQRAGIRTDIITGGVKKGMKRANKANASVALLIGADEQAASTIRMKNMISGEERTVSQEALVAELQS